MDNKTDGSSNWPSHATLQSRPGRETSHTSHSYQNVVAEDQDPFAGFEEAIKNSEVINIKKRPDQDDMKVVESPPVPDKKFSRSVSLVSRRSIQSGSSPSGSSPSQKSDVISPYRYDEVSLSYNFSKPVLASQPQSVKPDKPDDFFSGFSFTSPLEGVSAVENPYEDVELVMRNVEKLKLERTPPEPPPRNIILKPVKNNIYSVGSERSENMKNNNIMESMKENVDRSVEVDQVDSALRELGARPKTFNTSMTMDIRKKVSDWYEEAEKEVERDLSLDISQLEKKKTSKTKKPMEAYEHISMAVTGRPVLDDDQIVPRPTVTLLRDFDPCFDDLEEEDNGDLEQEVDELYDQIDEITVPGEVRVDPTPKVMPRTKFQIGSPKRINFGPPKPPRNFNYSSIKEDEESKTKESKVSPKSLKTMLSESNLLKAIKKSESAPGAGDHSDFCKKKTEKAATENIYVTVPFPSSSSVESVETPPPLPSSRPPAGKTHRPVTMYENVWVEPQSVPPIPPRAEPTKTGKLEEIFFNKKMSQESLISHNSSADSRLLTHRKTESVGSGSSGSLYSESSTNTTRNCDKTASVSSNSLENLSDGLSSSPRKKKVKKFPSTKSFTVGSITPKLNKLPSIASNLRRKVSDHIKPKENTSPVEQAGIFPETPDDSDHDENEMTFETKRESFLMPSEISKSTRNQSGALYIFSRSKKQFLCKWCVLGEGKFSWFNEDTSLAIPKESFLLTNIFSLTKKEGLEVGPQQQNLLCFDLAVLNSKGKFCVYVLGALTAHERETWLEKLVQSLSFKLSNFSMSQASRLGWAYIKLGFAADWQLSWLSLSNRHLCYTTQDSGDSAENIDLKKLKDMFIRKDSKNLNVPSAFSKHPVLVCDFNDRSLYILVGAEREGGIWMRNIEVIAFNNSNVLRDQQVTHDDVPVIVDKCIKFVYSHGIMTEGIYRKAGSNININKLLSEFRSNAWSVQISREDYSEHDVANVLKRFIRQLEEPLLTEQLRQDFLAVADIEQQEQQAEDEKLERYRQLLRKLPTINYNTLRRLIGHLYIVGDQCEKNLMPVFNLAPLWGPNMMTVDGQERNNFGQTSDEMEVFHAVGNKSTVVCADLIHNYPMLFNVDNLEVEKERRMLEVLEKINFPTPTSMKRSGDIRMWIYIESRTSGACISLVLHPSLTAGEAVLRAGQEAGLEQERLDKMFIHEVVLGGALERPLHHSHKLLHVTLSWGSWPESDRHDNYLLLKTNQFYSEALPCAVPPLSVAAELMFSDSAKSRSKFSSVLFSIARANITCYKEDTKTGLTSELAAWPVEDHTWYLGCEQRRGPPYNLNITFINKNGEVRSKESPMFGRVMSFSSRDLFVKWMAALLVAEFDKDLQPQPALVDVK